MDNKKKIVLIFAVLPLAALPTLDHIATAGPNPDVVHHIDAQVLVAGLGVLSAILLRPMIRERRRRSPRVAKRLDPSQAAK